MIKSAYENYFLEPRYHRNLSNSQISGYGARRGGITSFLFINQIGLFFMKIISWNTNGLRSTYKNGYFDTFIKKEKPDILCLQETKSEPEQLPQELLNYKDFIS